MFTALHFTVWGSAKALFRRGGPFSDASSSMLGVKPGDRAVVLGAAHPTLAAAVGVITGLNGQTTVVGRGADAKVSIERAAGEAGALLEFVDAPPTLAPLDANAWDVAILPHGITPLGSDAPLVLAEAIRLVRPSGRVLLCEPAGRGGLFRLAERTPPADPGALLGRLTNAGLRAARHLGDLDGIAYFEAAKPRTD
jgi:hypothetical protein